MMATQGDEESATPSWLQEEEQPTTTEDAENNDAQEEEEDESTPLFGTGAVSLQDSEEQKASGGSYGAVPTKTDATDEEEPDKVHEAKWHEDKPKQKRKKKKAKEKKTRRPPRKNWCLHFFTLVETIAVIACVGLLTTQVLPLFMLSLHEIGVLQLALRAYVSLFCLLFILVELEVPVGFVQNSAFLQNYFTRGFLYSFVGLIGMEEAYEVIVTHLVKHGEQSSAYEEFHIEWAPLFIKVTSWLMVVTGCMYMVLGLFFLKHLRDGLRRNYNQAMERYREQEEEENVV